VYLGVAGGYGQLYDIAFASLARLSGIRLFLHHHSYAYLQKRRPITAMLVRVAGPSATHIVLCEDMKERLIDLYGTAIRVSVVSNSTNSQPPSEPPRPRTRLNTIGFISHLSRSKGVLEFIDVADRLRRTHSDMQAFLAGPIDEPSLKPILARRLLLAPWIKYFGPIYGEAKSMFYRDIDVLVFPTRYINEAEPMVIAEALAHGVAVITCVRGCIGSVITGGGGVVIGEGRDVVAEAERVLLEWYRDSALFSSISSAALTNSARLRADNGYRLEVLMREITSPRQ
jgi:glycosyltransferase involved in cell wall biosynthesis